MHAPQLWTHGPLYAVRLLCVLENKERQTDTRLQWLCPMRFSSSFYFFLRTVSCHVMSCLSCPRSLHGHVHHMIEADTRFRITTTTTTTTDYYLLLFHAHQYICIRLHAKLEVCICPILSAAACGHSGVRHLYVFGCQTCKFYVGACSVSPIADTIKKVSMRCCAIWYSRGPFFL